MSIHLPNIPQEHRQTVASLPEALQQLLGKELAAGNSIAESGAGFPAPPCGALVRLSQPMKPANASGITGLRPCSYPNWTLKSGYCDAPGHFFIMNPPEPPPPPPDMDLIRAQHAPAEPAPGEVRSPRRRAGARKGTRKTRAQGQAQGGTTSAPAPQAPTVPTSHYGRFVASMNIDYEKWREGIGYDLDAIREAGEADRSRIEDLLVGRGGSTWRDVAALAALGTKRAMTTLRQALATGSSEVQMAVMNSAPDLVDHDIRTRTLVQALKGADLYAGLGPALDQVETFHPPEVIDALLWCALEREGGIAPSFAARLFFIHGISDSPFDWNHRPFFLRFNTADRTERETAFRELCERIGTDPSRYLRLRSGRRAT